MPIVKAAAWHLGVAVLAAFGNTTLSIQVSDYLSKPVPNVVITAKSSSTFSAPTDIAGKTQIVVVQNVGPGDEVPLVLVSGPPKLVMMAPWQGRAVLPRGLLIEVVLAAPGNTAALSNRKIVTALAEGIVQDADALSGDSKLSRKKKGISPSLSDAMLEVLKQTSTTYQFDLSDVDKAIREAYHFSPSAQASDSDNPRGNADLHKYVANLPADRIKEIHMQ